MATYKRLDVAFESGEGAWLIDRQGKRYLDALSGIAVCGLGHAHPGIAEVVARQARAAGSYFQSLPDTPAGGTGRTPGRDFRDGSGFFLQLGG